MTETTNLPPNIATLRLKVATNYFKRLLIGDLHVPGKAQTSTTFELLNGAHGVDEITERTWQSWFSNTRRIPKIDKVKTLDKMASSIIRVCSKSGIKDKTLPPDTFSHMIHGGLVSRMLARSKSERTLDILCVRANQYQPDSPLHLHLDAMEICALSDGYGDVPWDAVKKLGAKRILELLAEKWGPRQGSIYPHFSSRLRLEWDASSPEKRSEIREGYARFKPDLFESALDEIAHPNWSKIGIDADVSPLHVYKLLFALAADAGFLKADRMTAWALDLATGALAMHASACSEQDRNFDELMPDELIYWIAFDEILFTSESLDADNTEIIRAMLRLDADWSEASFAVFSRAREAYLNELSELGISVREVRDTAMLAN